MSKTIEQRLEDEQKFHNEIFETDQRTEKVGRFYAINDAIHAAYEGFIFDNPKDKVFLEYGCGMAKGGRSVRLAKRGAKVHGIDISDYAIEFLSKEAQEEGLEIDYQVMNAEDMTFDDDYFDVIYGTGILHHLNLDNSYGNLAQKLKQEGTAIFIEPLGHNPLINGFRNKTPDIRTDDEHPLLMRDFKLAKRYFKKVDVQYFYLTTLAVPILFKKNQPKFLIKFCNAIDKAIFFIMPFMRKHAWQVVVKFSAPK
jgi:SAM-dependent methyltransferase